MPSLDLETPVQFVRGVGPVRAGELAALGIATVGDLIEYIPFRYETFPKSVPIGNLTAEGNETVIGQIHTLKRSGLPGAQQVTAVVVDGTGRCRVQWFHSPHVADQVRQGDCIRISGRVTQYRELAQFVNPRFDIIDDARDPFGHDDDRFDPVYPATASMPSKAIGRMVASVLHQVVERIAETLPESIRQERRLPLRRTAILRIHRPVQADDAEIARRRLAYDEILLTQLAVRLIRRRRDEDRSAAVIKVDGRVDERIRRRLPFRLTPGQEAAVRQIVADLGDSRPMHRLLQADVGAGKTVIAIYAALAAIAARRQVAFLAPTEVLAQQHYRKVSQYLADSRVRIGLLVGGLATRPRDTLLKAVAAGEIDLLVGTHAMIEKDVAFRSLGLLVIDEQHKFGVAQRATARAKGGSPHTLVMTATPIPRTLAMTFFGDLDITTISDAPPGRRPIRTHIVRSDDADRMWNGIRQRAQSGEQAFVVCPLVEESDEFDAKAVTVECDRLRGGPLSGVSIDLLHGRMTAEQKDDAMRRFRNGEVRVLVSTTVIEVGVDVPDATMMVIEDADRFGLSQLHQLRGRVGRGPRESDCWLRTEASHDAASARLQVLVATTDGFRIAEADLALRGPGELLGRRQHGVPDFRAANLAADSDLVAAANADARQILDRDPNLELPVHAALLEAARRRFRGVGWLLDSANA